MLHPAIPRSRAWKALTTRGDAATGLLSTDGTKAVAPVLSQLRNASDGCGVWQWSLVGCCVMKGRIGPVQDKVWRHNWNCNRVFLDQS